MAQHVPGASPPIIWSNTTALAASAFTVGSGGCSVVGRGLRPGPTTMQPPLPTVKPEAASAVVLLLMMGGEAPETR